MSDLSTGPKSPLGNFVFETVQHTNAAYLAGMKAERERLRPFVVLVQDIAHQLQVMDNDNDPETKVERMRLIKALCERADAMAKADGRDK